MLFVSWFAGDTHKDLDDNAVSDIGCRVDAVGKECRAVADNPDTGFKHGEDYIGAEADIDRQKAYSLSHMK